MAEMWISMGPQHPMTHGLWTLKVKVDGETVVDTEPDLGYIHRGVEKYASHVISHRLLLIAIDSVMHRQILGLMLTSMLQKTYSKSKFLRGRNIFAW